MGRERARGVVARSMPETGGDTVSPAEVGAVARWCLTPFDEATAAAVLFAACSSPGAVHRLPTLASLLVENRAGASRGRRLASSEDVAVWTNEVRFRVPAVIGYEDWLPHDPATLVRVRWNGRMWPLHPGLLRYPQDLPPRLRDWARAADETLLPSLGFGIGDVVELALRLIAVQRLALVGSWNRERPVDPTEAVKVTAGEITAAAEFLDQWRAEASSGELPACLTEIGGCGDLALTDEQVGRLIKAMNWSTRDAEELSAHPGWLLQGGLLLRDSEQRVWPAPAGLILADLHTAATTLIASAGRRQSPKRGSQSGPRPADLVTQGLVAQAEARFVESARGLPAHLAGPVVADAVGDVSALLVPGGRHLIAVQVVAGIDRQATAREADRARRRLQRLRPGAVIRYMGNDARAIVGSVSDLDLPFESGVLTGTAGRVYPDVNLRRVVLVAGPWVAPWPRRPGVVLLSIDEWCQVAAQAMDDPEEFWAFLDELAELPGLHAIAPASARDLDLWHLFRRRGMFYRRGEQPEDEPPPDPGIAWENCAKADPFEAILYQLGMPWLCDWPYRGPAEDGPMSVGSLTPRRHVLLHANPPLALAMGQTGDQGADLDLAPTLAEAIAAGVTELQNRAGAGDSAARAGWTAWAQAFSDRPVHIELVPQNTESEQQIRLLVSGEQLIVVGYRLIARVQGGSRAVHDLLGQVLADAIAAGLAVQVQPVVDGQILDSRVLRAQSPQADEAGQRFMQAWKDLPLTLRVMHPHMTLHTRPEAPGARISSRARARAERDVTEIAYATDKDVLSTQIDDPAEFLATVVVPAAWHALADDLADFDPHHAVIVAARETERLWADRERADAQRIVRQTAGWEPLPNAEDEVHHTTLACRAADLIIEAMLHTPSKGARRLDNRDWARLLSRAATCLHVAGRLVALRAGIDSIESESRAEQGEIPDLTLSRNAPVLVDMNELTEIRIRIHDQHRANELSVLSEQDCVDCQVSDGIHRFHRWTDAMRESGRTAPTAIKATIVAAAALAVDEEMRRTLGTGIDEILAILSAAGSRMVANNGETTTITSHDLVRLVADWSGISDTHALAVAVELLTLTPQRLAAEGLRYDTLQGRSARLASRPFVPLPDSPGVLCVLPRRTEASLRLFLTYLDAGRLPWPPTALPKPVNTALSAWQQHKQTAFELAMESVVRRDPRLVLLPRLKPHKAVKRGFRIPGEIDLMIIDRERRRVWVVEAKDCQVSVDPDRLLHDVTDFHGAGDHAGGIRKGYARTPSEAFVGKLLAKTAAVESQISAVVADAGFDSENGSWTVIPLFVTATPVPAAFVADPQVAFTCLSNLHGVLNNPGTPHPGYHG